MNKKLILLFASIILTKSVSAQDSDKKFRFGLKLTPSLNWYKPDNKKKFESAGVAAKTGYGLVTEFKLTNVAFFSTGLQVDYDGGKITFKDTSVYYLNSDEALVELEKVDTSIQKLKYLLKERKYRTSYITIPLQLRLKTKEIGAMTYFGEFGFLTSIRLKARANDNVNQANSGTGNGVNPTNVEITDLNISDDMSPIKLALNIGFGAEMNLSGSTSVFGGLSYTQGFTNVAKTDSKYIATKLGGKTPIEQKFFGKYITLTIGVLF